MLWVLVAVVPEVWLVPRGSSLNGTERCGAQHRISPPRPPGPNWAPEKLPAEFYGWRVGCNKGQIIAELLKEVGNHGIWVLEEGLPQNQQSFYLSSTNYMLGTTLSAGHVWFPVLPSTHREKNLGGHPW